MNQARETVLVTGGAGYVGAVLVPKLVAQGHRVRVLDTFWFADEGMFGSLKGSGLEVVRGDLRNRGLIEECLQGVSQVIHLAGISNDPSSDLDPELTREVNIRATSYLIDRARDLGVQKFINASSSSVYGIKEEPSVTEELPLSPLTVYSESKVAIEQYLAASRGKMAAISIRSATVCGYSPRMRFDLTVNILTHHALKKGKITVFGGVQKRPNIHIEDITDLYAMLLTLPASQVDGWCLNACGANHTVAALAELVQQTVAPGVPIVVEPTNDLRSYHVCGDKIGQVLGFKANRTIERAIQDVAAALEDGRLPQPDNDRHYNVRVMKQKTQQK